MEPGPRRGQGLSRWPEASPSISPSCYWCSWCARPWNRSSLVIRPRNCIYPRPNRSPLPRRDRRSRRRCPSWLRPLPPSWRTCRRPSPPLFSPRRQTCQSRAQLRSPLHNCCCLLLHPHCRRFPPPALHRLCPPRRPRHAPQLRKPALFPGFRSLSRRPQLNSRSLPGRSIPCRPGLPAQLLNPELPFRRASVQQV